MSKRREETKTTEFEVEGIEEAIAPAPPSKHISAPGQPWKPLDLPRLEVETPPELQAPVEHSAKIWILERRARGLLAIVRRWFIGKSR